MIDLSKRKLFFSSAAILAAPAIVRASSLMPMRASKCDIANFYSDLSEHSFTVQWDGSRLVWQKALTGRNESTDDRVFLGIAMPEFTPGEPVKWPLNQFAR